MKLTGKCKEDFEKWVISNKINQEILEVDSIDFYGSYDLYDLLDKLPLSCKFGVYVDFFDSVGIRILIDMDFENEVYDKFVLYIEYKKHCFCNYGMNFKTRPEARTEAVKMANEIYTLNK